MKRIFGIARNIPYILVLDFLGFFKPQPDQFHDDHVEPVLDVGPVLDLAKVHGPDRFGSLHHIQIHLQYLQSTIDSFIDCVVILVSRLYQIGTVGDSQRKNRVK